MYPHSPVCMLVFICVMQSCCQWSNVMSFHFQERASEDSREASSFRDLLEARTQEYIEEVLSPYFGSLTTFVKDAESRIERGQADSMKQQDSKIPLRYFKIHDSQLQPSNPFDVAPKSNFKVFHKS